MRVLRPRHRRSWCGPRSAGAAIGTATPSTRSSAAATSATETGAPSASSVTSPSSHSMALTRKTPDGRGRIDHAPCRVRFQLYAPSAPTPGTSISGRADATTALGITTSAARDTTVLSVTPGNPSPASSRTRLCAPSHPTTYEAGTSCVPCPSRSRTVTPWAASTRSTSSHDRRTRAPSSVARSPSARSSSCCDVLTPCNRASPAADRSSRRPPNWNTEAGAGARAWPSRASTPRWPSSRVACPITPLALGSRPGSARRSMTVTAIPASARSPASRRPVGPAPTTTTSP